MQTLQMMRQRALTPRPKAVEVFMRLLQTDRIIAISTLPVKGLKAGQTFELTTPNIFFVPRSLKRSATILDPLAQLHQHRWGHARPLYMVSLKFTKSYGLYPFARCTAGPNIVGSCCIRLHTTAKAQCWELMRLFTRSLRTLDSYYSKINN